MEVAGIESCGFGVGPMTIPSKDNNREKQAIKERMDDLQYMQVIYLSFG